MTQLLLFDTPAAESFAPITAPVEETFTTAVTPNRSPEAAAENQHQPGLNHMGDLARLVLLRYDLVAQRRARRLARAAK